MSIDKLVDNSCEKVNRGVIASSGVINVYKPTGMTSFDVVRKIKKLAKQSKVGHAGTLDPEASGVLPVCIGKATKAIDYIMDDFKIYNVELKLGIVTDTYDREGKIISEKDVNVTEKELINCINSFIGEIEQIPPMYSALKVNGKKLYELARQGIEIERKARKINIFNIDIEDINLPYAKFTVKCSKGTYIRSLCYDIGDKLNCGAMMWNLERAATGQFILEEAVNINDLTEENLKSYIIPIDKAFESYELLTVNPKFEKLLLNGVAVKDKNLLNKVEKEKMYRIYNEQKELMGIGMDKNDVGFKIIKLFI